MLRGLRKASSNWLGKAVMAAVVGFLVISFAIWGIGDIFRGFGRSTVAKVGRTEISVEQFRTIYNERLQQYARQLGRPIGAEQARALGLDQIVLRQIISEMLLDERARAMGLALSDADVSKQITSDPTFQGPNGQFDRFRFEQIIRNAGFTEARFVAEQRRRLLRRQLGGTFASGMEAPNALVDAANRFQNEQRSVEYLLIDGTQAGEIPAPSPEELAKYYESRKVLFRAPEFRKLVIVSLIPAEQAAWIEVSDADLKRPYEERRDRYSTPERRHVLQIGFPNAEAAHAAAERVHQGASFAEIAKELGKTEKDIDLGMVAKSGMIDKAVAEAAFSLKEGEVSAPIQGRFGTVLVTVDKIEPEKVRSFEEVAGELKQELATARAKAQVQEVYNKIEDGLLEGKPLAELAESLKLAARTIEAVDRSGHDPSGAVVSLPDQQRLLAAAFSAEMGDAHDPLQVQDGYVWYEVAGVTPSRERPLEEVKELVETRWREQETSTRVNTKAAEILEKIKGGAAFADVAATSGVQVATSSGLKRGQASPPLSVTAVDAIFRTAKDAVAKAEGAQPTEQIVFRVTDIVIPTLDGNAKDTKQLSTTLTRGISEDMFAEYVAKLENEVGVTINQSALTQVISGGTGGDMN
ncbi:MAG: SurA N-terminal domain-containing protein [Xanthobacteraceae bacterium]